MDEWESQDEHEITPPAVDTNSTCFHSDWHRQGCSESDWPFTGTIRILAAYIILLSGTTWHKTKQAANIKWLTQLSENIDKGWLKVTGGFGKQ